MLDRRVSIVEQATPGASRAVANALEAMDPTPLPASTAEVVADHGHDPDLREERRGNREIGRGAADDPIRFAKRGLDRVERDRTNSENRIHRVTPG